MGDKIYIHHLNDGSYKTILKNQICKGCGKEPHYEMVMYSNGISKPNLMMKGWESINDLTYCPLCVRREKIKKIING